MDDETVEVAIDVLAVLAWGAAGAGIALAISLLITMITVIAARRRHALRIFSQHVRFAQRIFCVAAGAGIGVLFSTREFSGEDEPLWRSLFEHGFIIALILLAANVLIAALRGGETIALDRYETDSTSIHARRVRTQMQVIRRVGIAVVTVCAIAGILLTFEQFRTIGIAMFGSAGLLSIVLGLAAQSSLGNLFAGIQIAFTDAIRVDDVVIVEGEFGTVEELTLTYVVVRTWDDRRLIMPSTYFTTTTFQNWTRREPKLLGTVYFDLDVMTPVKAMRVELQRIVEASEAWDGRTAGLQITDMTGGKMEVRAVVSAATSGLLWDLRCEVREKMVEWIQNEVPYAMTRMRVEPEPTSAPSEEIRASFIADTEREWADEKEKAKAEAADTLDELRAVDSSAPTRESIVTRRAREAAARRDRKAARRHPGRLAYHGPLPPRPSADETQLIPMEELSAPSANETEHETDSEPHTSAWRLFSGSPDAEERGQRLSGPPPQEMVERETIARRRIWRKKTGVDPAIADEIPPGADLPEDAPTTGGPAEPELPDGDHDVETNLPATPEETRDDD